MTNPLSRVGLSWPKRIGNLYARSMAGLRPRFEEVEIAERLEAYVKLPSGEFLDQPEIIETACRPERKHEVQHMWRNLQDEQFPRPRLGVQVFGSSDKLDGLCETGHYIDDETDQLLRNTKFYFKRQMTDAEELEDLQLKLKQRRDKYRWGWMQKQLLIESSVITGRAHYWAQQARRNKASNHPIPWLDFGDGHDRSKQYLEHCLDQIHPQWSVNSSVRWQAVEFLFDWMLWSFGHPLNTNMPVEPFPENGQIYNRLAQTFTTAMYFLFEPADYFGTLLEEYADERYQPPKQLSMLESVKLAQRLFPAAFTEHNSWRKPRRPNRGMPGFTQIVDYRDATLPDFECGSGRLMMAASNYCCGRWIATNRDPLQLKAALINCFLYAPYTIWPHQFIYEKQPSQQLEQEEQIRLFAIAQERGLPRHYFEDVTPIMETDGDASEYSRPLAWRTMPIIQCRDIEYHERDRVSSLLSEIKPGQ